jgi:hypothetical protein
MPADGTLAAISLRWFRQPLWQLMSMYHTCPCVRKVRPRCTLYALRDHPPGPQRPWPREVDRPASLIVRGPRLPSVPKMSQEALPSPAVRSAGWPLPYRPAGERLPSRLRRRDLRLSRDRSAHPCRSNGDAGVLFHRQVRWTQWARWLGPVLPPSGADC